MKYYPTIKGHLFERFPGFKFEYIKFGKDEICDPVVVIVYSDSINKLYMVPRRIIGGMIDWHQNDVVSNEVRMVCERYLKNIVFS